TAGCAAPCSPRWRPPATEPANWRRSTADPFTHDSPLPDRPIDHLAWRHRPFGPTPAGPGCDGDHPHRRSADPLSAAHAAGGGLLWGPSRTAILGGVFTLDAARAELARLRPRIDALLVRRADLAELRADLDAGRDSPHGRLADAKAAEAALFAELERFAESGAHVK